MMVDYFFFFDQIERRHKFLAFLFVINFLYGRFQQC